MSPSRNLACVTRYRRFESGFLQRGVCCEPAPLDQGAFGEAVRGEAPNGLARGTEDPMARPAVEGSAVYIVPSGGQVMTAPASNGAAILSFQSKAPPSFYFLAGDP